MQRRSVIHIALIALCCSVVAVLFGWWCDRYHLVGQLNHARRQARYDEAHSDVDELKALLDALALGGGHKPDYWRVSDYLGTNTAVLEHELGLSNARGELITSHGVGGDVELRQPRESTFREVAAFLDSKRSIERARAAKLLALYGEAYRESPVNPYEDHILAEHGRYSWATEPVPTLIELLDDQSSQVRGGAALALAHLGTDHAAARHLSQAFARESDGTTRLFIAWALDRLIRPRPVKVLQPEGAAQ